jgi:hypothetical protein
MKYLVCGIFCLLILIITGLGCSNPQSMVTEPAIPDSLSTGNDTFIWSSGYFSWDGKSDQLDIETNRDLSAHYNINPFLIPNYFRLSIVSWDPITRIMIVNGTIENPTALDVYDVRLILYNLGSRKLLNADNYTKLFDPNTPLVPNPFKAYAKEETKRKLSGNYADPSKYIKTETFELYFPDVIGANFVITASFPTNAVEPYVISSIVLNGTIYETSGSMSVDCQVRDWENTTASDVIIEKNAVLASDVHMFNNTTYGWHSLITNTGGAAPGIYDTWIAAYDLKTPLAIYEKIQIEVHEDEINWSFYDDFASYPYVWTAYGGDFWGEYGGWMDAKGGTDCYEEDTGETYENPNVSYVSSPSIEIPDYDADLVMTINHTIDVDYPEEIARFAWDMCYVRINGQNVSPASGSPYELNHYPWTFDEIYCWTGEYAYMENKFNLGRVYNGTIIRVEFVLDTYDYIDNCDPPNFGWMIDDVKLEFE